MRNRKRELVTLHMGTGRHKLYFVRAGEHPLAPVKIGVSTDPGARLMALQCANPAKLQLTLSISGADPKIESIIHTAFARWRMRGEWFHYQGPAEGLFNLCNRLASEEIADEEMQTARNRYAIAKFLLDTKRQVSPRKEPEEAMAEHSSTKIHRGYEIVVRGTDTKDFPAVAYIAKTRQSVVAECALVSITDESAEVATLNVVEALDALSQNGLL